MDSKSMDGSMGIPAAGRIDGSADGSCDRRSERSCAVRCPRARRRAPWRWRTLALAVAALALSSVAADAVADTTVDTTVDTTPSVAPLSPEIPFGTTIGQRAPDVARRADGSFVTAWLDQTPGQSDYRVLAQRHTADGTVLGSPIAVTAAAASTQDHIRIAGNAVGTFLLSWIAQGAGGAVDVYARAYAADGTPITSALDLYSSLGSDVPAGDLALPVMAVPLVDAAGRFAVVWTVGLLHYYAVPPYGLVTAHGEIYVQRFNADGSAQAPAQHFADAPAGLGAVLSGSGAEASIDAKGDLVVVWTPLARDYRPHESQKHVYSVRYPAGQPLGSVPQVLSPPASLPVILHPQVASDALGNFTIAWAGGQSGGSSDPAKSLIFQRFNAAACALGTMQVEALPGLDFSSGTIFRLAMAADGRSLTAWPEQRSDADGQYLELHGRYWDSGGAPLGAAFLLSASPRDVDNGDVALALDAGAGLVAAWNQGRVEDPSPPGVVYNQNVYRLFAPP